MIDPHEFTLFTSDIYRNSPFLRHLRHLSYFEDHILNTTQENKTELLHRQPSLGILFISSPILFISNSCLLLKHPPSPLHTQLFPHFLHHVQTTTRRGSIPKHESVISKYQNTATKCLTTNIFKSSRSSKTVCSKI